MSTLGTIWVKGETALHHLTEPNTKHWGTQRTSKKFHNDADQLGSLPSPRFQHASVHANGKLIIMGGSQGTEIFNDIHIFEPITFKWTRYKEHKESELRDKGRARHTVTYMQEKNALYLFGGINIAGIASNTVYTLNLSTDLTLKDGKGYFTWHEMKVQIGQEIPTSRFAHCATSACNKLFVFGGERKNKKRKFPLLYSYDEVYLTSLFFSSCHFYLYV